MNPSISVETNKMPAPKAVKQSETIPGTGLPGWAFALIVLISTGLFLVWDGLLWKTTPHASHVGRFAVSYLAVLPLSAAALALFKRFSWDRLITTTGTAWAVKLVITALLYEAFARGTAVHVDTAKPAPTPSRVSTAERIEYKAAPGAFEEGEVRGLVRAGPKGKGIEGAIVFLEEPNPGKALNKGRRVELRIEGMRLGQRLWLLHTNDEIQLTNGDSVLHTAHVHAGNKAIANEPLPPQSEAHALRALEPGVYALKCANHANSKDESATLAVVDHPYAVRSDKDGSFVIKNVPAGHLKIKALSEDSMAAQSAELKSGGSVDILFELVANTKE